MEELKKCPFCGGKVRIVKIGDNEDEWWLVTRGFGEKGCKCRVFMESGRFAEGTDGKNEKLALIRKWNTRNPMEQIVERLEQQVEQCKRRSHELVDKNTEAGIHIFGKACSYEHAIEIVKEEGGL